jgi:hypothetical protein
MKWQGKGWYAERDGQWRIVSSDRQRRPVIWGKGYERLCWYETEHAYVVGKGWGK